MKISKKVFGMCMIAHSLLLQSMDLLETKEALVERTKSLPPSKRYTNPFAEYFIEPKGASISHYVMCPHNKDCALLRLAEGANPPQLVILNDRMQVYARQFLKNKKFIALALQSKLGMFATVYEKNNNPVYPYPAETTEILQIQEIATKKRIKKIPLPRTFELASTFNAHAGIAFNKQGTHIIVWGNDATKNKSWKSSGLGIPALNYMIIDIENKQTISC